jgi:oligo-1,6-glucosidase
VSRFGDDGAYRVESAKMLATFNHLLQGTPYIYQGEEIGMTNVAFASIDDYRDIESRNNYRSLVEEHGVSPADALRFLHARSRDNARTPMQWDSGPQAGFTAGKPWIGVNPNYPEISVAQDRSRPDSIFAYYQALIRLRRSNPVVVYGRYGLLLPEHHQIHAFTRTLGDDRLLVALNFSGEPAAARLPEPIASASRGLLLGNYTDAPPGGASPELSLRAFEAQVWRVEQQAAP